MMVMTAPCSDVSAIEDRARANLGMVYPGQIVLRLPRMAEAETR